MIHSLNSTLLAALLAFGAQAASQTTPRALLERGALAEEHQRDFAGAQKLYEQAEAAAKAAGDAKTAAEASAAKERVLARQGKRSASTPAQDVAVWSQLRNRAMTMLADAQSDLPSLENIRRVAQRLVDLGPVALDLVAASLTDSVTEVGGDHPAHVPSVAALALVMMNSAEADRALIAAFDSPDPTIRKAVVDAASDQRFLELSLRAATDPVASIRDMAATRLLSVEDPRAVEAVVDLMASSQLQGGMRQAAAIWLVRNAPRRLFQIAFDASRPQEQRAAAFGVVRGGISDAVLLDLLRRTRALGAADATTRELAFDALRSVNIQGAEAAGDRDELAGELARVEHLELDAWAVMQLAAAKPSAAMSPLLAALARRQGRAEKADLERLMLAVAQMLHSAPDAYDLAAWSAAAAACDTSWPSVNALGETLPIHEHIWRRLALSKSPPTLTEFARQWSKIPESHRPAYARAVATMLSNSREPKPAEKAGEVADPLLRFMLQSDDRNMKQTALNQLTAEAHPRLIEEAVAAHEAGADARVYIAAAFSTAPEDTCARLIPALQRRLESPPVLAGSVWTLQLIAALDKRAALESWDQLWSAAQSARSRAALLETLIDSSLNSPERDARLVELYPAIERDAKGIRSRALQRFGLSLLESALPILEREVRNPESEVRSAAMKAAAAFREHREAIAEFDAWRKAVTVEQSTVAELSKLLESPNRDVLLGAVRALAILRARPALPALVKLLERDDKELRAAVQAALDAIGR